jgi:hypothetical protein
MAFSSEFVVQELKGITESFAEGTKLMIEQYMSLPVFNIKTNRTYTEIFTTREGLSGTKELAELESPPVNALEDGRSVSLSSSRYGNAILVSETAMIKMRDGTIKVDEFLIDERNRLLLDVKNSLITKLHVPLNQAFSSTTTLAPDGVTLCGTHSWATPGAATWSNAATAALDLTAYDTANAYAGAFTDASGKPNPLNWTHIIVKKGGAASRAARKIFAEKISPIAIGDINLYEGELTIVETPYLTSGTAWFLFDSRIDVSPVYMGINDMPALREPITESNQAIRSNCTGFWKNGIIKMPLNIYGSTGVA